MTSKVDQGFFFSNRKGLPKHLLITSMTIMCTILVATCELLKKFYYKNMIITLKTTNRMFITRFGIRHLLLYLFTNVLLSLFEFLEIKTIFYIKM